MTQRLQSGRGAPGRVAVSDRDIGVGADSSPATPTQALESWAGPLYQRWLSQEEMAAYEALHRDEWRRIGTRDLEDELDYAEREIAELEHYDAIKDGFLTIWDYAGSLVYRRRLIRDELKRRKQFERFARERPSLSAFSHMLKERVPLHEYIVSLGYCPDMKRRGRYYSASCPFHSEKTPSFFVFSEPLGHFKCFGCGIGGDVFDFLMTSNRVDGWRQAVEEVAGYVGVAMPQPAPARW